MIRILLVFLLAAATAFAHGGAFRPPPKKGPGDDPGGGDPGGGPTTPGGGGTGKLPMTPARTKKQPTVVPWESWWHLNRDVYLRVRERMLEREVVTGPTKRTDLFDRRALREHVLEPEVLVALRDRAPAVRAAAAIAAGKFRMTEAVPVLLEMFRRDKDREVRESCVLGLLHMRDTELVEVFHRILLDPRESRRVRGFAVLALGFIRDTPFLSEVARHEGVRLKGSKTLVRDLRACAALALGYSGDMAALAPLLAVTMDEEAPRGARGFAAASLGRLGTPLALPEVLKLVKSRSTKLEVRYGAAIAAGHLVQPTEDRFVDLLARRAQRDKSAGVRGLLLMSLGRIGGARARDHVLAAMPESEVLLRGFHYLSLGIMGEKAAGPALLKEFEGLSQNNDRAACALALGLLGYTKAAPALRAQTEKGHLGLAPHGMIALALLNDRQAIPIVERLLKKRDPGLRREGVIALALLKQSAAIPQLVDLLENASSWYTRGSVAKALGIVGNEKAVEPLLKIYRDKRRQAEERAVALAALGRIGDPEPVPLLSRIAFDLNPYVIVDAVQEVLTIL